MPKTVLIVDDSMVMRKLLARMLKDSGFDCIPVEAGTGHEGLIKFSAHAIDLVLCDWNMPAMNGLQMVEEIRKLDPAKKVPIIMITTQADAEKVTQAIMSGVQNYLIKPFTPEQLKKKLGDLLSADESAPG